MKISLPTGEMFASIQKALSQMVKFKLPEDQVQICNTQYSLSHCCCN